jgi:hypothetical protein
MNPTSIGSHKAKMGQSLDVMSHGLSRACEPELSTILRYLVRSRVLAPFAGGTFVGRLAESASNCLAEYDFPEDLNT